MFCSQCGTQLVPNAKFCSKCGQSAGGELSRVGGIAADQTTTVAPGEVIVPAALGTKWLKFWNYFSLPAGGVLGLLMSLGLPALLIIIMVPLATLQFVMAYGLHYRKLWAWRWNWVFDVSTYIAMIIPIQTPGSHGRTADLVVLSVIKLILGSLIWMWPNYVYWLFS